MIFYDPRNLGQKGPSQQKESFQLARLSVKDADSRSMTMQHLWQTLQGLMGIMQSILGSTLKVIVLSCCRLLTMMPIVYRQVIMQLLGMEYHHPLVEHQRTFLMTYNTRNLTWTCNSWELFRSNFSLQHKQIAKQKGNYNEDNHWIIRI